MDKREIIRSEIKELLRQANDNIWSVRDLMFEHLDTDFFLEQHRDENAPPCAKAFLAAFWGAEKSIKVISGLTDELLNNFTAESYKAACDAIKSKNMEALNDRR